MHVAHSPVATSIGEASCSNDFSRAVSANDITGLDEIPSLASRIDFRKIQKDIDKIIKKINKNKKYFYSAKDLALIDSLIKDGFKIPANFNYKKLSEKYEIPKNLLQLINKNQSAFLALKIVEIIGEDEPYQLDPETIYFITNLLNQTDLIEIRNKVIISALPQRV